MRGGRQGTACPDLHKQPPSLPASCAASAAPRLPRPHPAAPRPHVPPSTRAQERHLLLLPDCAQPGRGHGCTDTFPCPALVSTLHGPARVLRLCGLPAAPSPCCPHLWRGLAARFGGGDGSSHGQSCSSALRLAPCLPRLPRCMGLPQCLDASAVATRHADRAPAPCPCDGGLAQMQLRPAKSRSPALLQTASSSPRPLIPTPPWSLGTGTCHPTPHQRSCSQPGNQREPVPEIAANAPCCSQPGLGPAGTRHAHGDVGVRHDDGELTQERPSEPQAAPSCTLTLQLVLTNGPERSRIRRARARLCGDCPGQAHLMQADTQTHASRCTKHRRAPNVQCQTAALVPQTQD